MGDDAGTRPTGHESRKGTAAGMSDLPGMLNLEMSRRGTSPVLIGRANELCALRTSLETVRQGGPSALLIGGEAGLGKTRLIGEFAAEARAAGARVLTGACLELGAEGLPFSPFTAILRDLVREIGIDELLGMLPGSGRAGLELARLLPELAVSRLAGEAGGAHSASAAGEARARLFEEFLTLLERLAGQRPLILVIEDAHWADRSSRDLIAFLIGYQRALRNVLIVVTFRSDEMHRTHPLRPLLAELARIEWVERMELPRLTRGQAEELAAAVLGRALDRTLSDVLYKRAEGNPLFTEELLACPDSGHEIPDSLADLLQQTVRRLPDSTQEVLRVASAGSGSIGHALLANVTGRSEEELAAFIRPAVAANVLVTTSDGYAFRHALIREAVHEDLLPGEHAAVHTRFARAIDANPALVPDGRADIELAHHWHAAHNTIGALTSAWRASAQASRAVAQAERLALLARVLELWDQVPDAATRIGVDHGRILEEAVTAAQDAGEHQRGLAFTESALSELDEVTEPVRVALLLNQRSTFRHGLGLGSDMAAMLRALALVPETVSRPARTQLLLSASHCVGNGRNPQFRAWAEEALRFAREAGDLDSEAHALARLAMMEAGPSSIAMPGSAPLKLLAQAGAIIGRTDAFHPTVKLVVFESHLLCGAGEFEQAARVARQGIADAERHGLARTGGAFLAINLAEPLYYLGRWDEAAEAAERALDLAPPPLTRVGLWIILGWIATVRGDLGTAARRAAASRAMLSVASYEDQYHLPQAELDIAIALAAEGPDAAVTLAAEALERYDVLGSSPRYAWPLLVASAAAARRTPGDDAAALLDRLRAFAEKLDAFGPVQQAWRLSFAALTGRSGGEQLDAADAAVAEWEQLGQLYPAAEALAHAARTALACGKGREGAKRLRRAAAIARRLGTQPLTEQIAGLARRTGEDGKGSDGGLSLTGRETEVLRLVAVGRSNREIAAALVISPKTASVHVSNILAKLATGTRTEAAVKAHELGLLDILA
jgi:DNA-binding CsgD family transcriptional regulator/tetratricopeptide (TPR) repeat protein